MAAGVRETLSATSLGRVPGRGRRRSCSRARGSGRRREPRVGVTAMPSPGVRRRRCSRSSSRSSRDEDPLRVDRLRGRARALADHVAVDVVPAAPSRSTHGVVSGRAGCRRSRCAGARRARPARRRSPAGPRRDPWMRSPPTTTSFARIAIPPRSMAPFPCSRIGRPGTPLLVIRADSVNVWPRARQPAWPGLSRLVSRVIVRTGARSVPPRRRRLPGAPRARTARRPPAEDEPAAATAPRGR